AGSERPVVPAATLPNPPGATMNVPVTKLEFCVSASKSVPCPGTKKLQFPVAEPTTNVRVSVAVAPLLSVTVTRAVLVPPPENVIVPFVPLNGLPPTSHEYVSASPSGSDADALNENC